MSKAKILLLSHYLGSLRYLEKLIPYLQARYDFCFLLTPKIKQHFIAGIIEYCQQKNYPYYLIVKPTAPKWLQRIPFLYFPLWLSLSYRWQIKKLLRDKSIKKIIATSDTNFYFNCLFDKANKKGIDTVVLQWSRTRESGTPRLSKKEKIKLTLKNNFLRGAAVLLQRMLVNLVMPRGNKIKTIGGGKDKKFGVFNQQYYQAFKKFGVPEEKMAIVGSLDFALAEELQKKFNNNPALKKQTAKKYQISLNKKNIIIFSNPYNNVKELAILTDEQQLQHYERIVQSIREVFSHGEADILLKIHPAENINLYQPLTSYGVKPFDKTASNEELICLADLYIAGGTTANFIPLIMQKDIIFINFINLARIDETKPNFAVKQFVKDKTTFIKLLADFKQGKLEKQYFADEQIITRNSIQKILDWLG